MFVSNRVLHQTLACSSVFFNQFLIGLAYGWIPITLRNLQDGDYVSNEEASWIVSISELGKISGPMFAPFVIDNFGRRPTMILVTVCLVLMWPSIFFAQNAHLLYIIRFAFGCVHGLFDVLSSIYITENCSPKLRVVIGSILTIVFTGGISAETILATYLSYESTVLVNAALAACAFSTIYFCTETPHFLVMKGMCKEAEEKLSWLMGLRATDDCSEGIKQIESETRARNENEKPKSLKVLLSSPVNARSICLVLSMHVISMMTGSSAVAPFSSMIFSSSDALSVNQYVIMYGACVFSSACLSPFVILKFKRRALLIVSFLIIGVAHLISTMLLCFHNRGYEIIFYPWLIFLSVASYGAVRQMFGPALYIIRAELLPTSVRAIGGSMTVITSAVTGFFMAKTFLPITALVGLEMNFFIYLSMSVLMALLIYHFLPESSGQSFDQIQKELESKKSIKKDAKDFVESTPESKESGLHTLFR